MKIKLQEYLKRHGYASSNTDARRLIRDHIVTLHGVPLQSCSAMVSSEKSPSIQISWKRRGRGMVVIDAEQTTSAAIVSNTAIASSSSASSSPATATAAAADEDEGGKGPQQQEEDEIPSCCIAYNKPCGMICTQSPTETKLCLVDIDPRIPDPYHPVGRLDQHSHGLLLFSSDGRLTSRLLSPTSAIERVYQIVVQGDVGERRTRTTATTAATAAAVGNADGSSSSHDLQPQERYEEIRMLVEKGIHTDYGFFKGRIISMERNVESNFEHSKCGVNCGGRRKDVFDSNGCYNSRMMEKEEGKCNEGNPILSRIVVAVQEGKKRMVRRLFAAIGLFVIDLKRIKYGQVNLGDLPVGKWRYLTKEESKYCQEQIKYWREKGPSWDII